MTKIKEYTTKGQTKYKFAFYAGIDDVTGKKKYIHKQGFKTKKEARLAVSRLELQKASGELSPLTNNNLTFEAVADQYMEAKKHSIRDSTYQYQAGWLNNHILKSFGKLKIQAIKGYQCQNAINDWFIKSPSAIDQIAALANQVFSYAIKNGYINKSPMQAVILPKKPEKKLTDNYFTKEELAYFLEYVKKNKPERYPLYRFLAFSGVRIGEALALTWDDIDFNAATVTIDKTISRGLNGPKIERPKTKAGWRKIAMDKITMQALASQQQAQNKRLFALGLLNTLPKPLPVFDNGTGRRPYITTAKKQLQAIYRKLPSDFKKITLHGFRHTHATLLIESGASIKTVQQRLGHANISMTLGVYAHATKKMETDAINRLNMYFSN
ncbi:site-specific integrase [Ligilactobacillus equi]|uniref:Phage-related integrase n=1 Tax=Ligilactobacillus equi DSM 15833 = JCM 10991 TaxID=1423740 RepID=A0A0R1TLV9_9LACO|nr:site-specific integrase [Ligilactobacillus equi]KRL79509.1 phage-related integrase [Ligilactobacillus equi DSM 15833 = JCM 10991]